MTPSAVIRRCLKITGRSVLRLLRSGPADGTPILAYHSVDDSGSILSVSSDQLRSQLGLLRAADYQGLTAAEWMLQLTAGKSATTPQRQVWLTFDDGYANFYRAAVPLLNEFGFPATVFIVPSLMEKTAIWYERDWHRIRDMIANLLPNRATLDKQLKLVHEFAGARLMTWEQASEIKEMGFDIGSHSNSHHFLTSLSSSELADDLRSSRESLEDRLGAQPGILCYPYGYCDERVELAAQAAGFKAGLAAEPDVVSEGPLRIPRWGVYGGTTLTDLQYSLSRAAQWEAALRRKWAGRVLGQAILSPSQNENP